MNEKKAHIEEFKLYIIAKALKEGKDPKDYTEDELKSMYVDFMKSKKQKAAHGTKLQYFRSLKNQCAEDEEVYYYKKGGSVGCGCKKKENGGEVKKAGFGCSVVDKFKSARKMNTGGQLKLDPKTTKTLPGGKYPTNWTSQDRQTWERYHGDNDEGAAAVPGIDKTKTTSDKVKSSNLNSSLNKVPYIEADSFEITSGRPRPSKNAKPRTRNSEQYMSLNKKGGEVKKDCGGSKVVAKFKKHRQGGSLNGIPFIREELMKIKFSI